MPVAKARNRDVKDPFRLGINGRSKKGGTVKELEAMFAESRCMQVSWSGVQWRSGAGDHGVSTEGSVIRNTIPIFDPSSTLPSHYNVLV
jgi:hypothetical protein